MQNIKELYRDVGNIDVRKETRLITSTALSNLTRMTWKAHKSYQLLLISPSLAIA